MFSGTLAGARPPALRRGPRGQGDGDPCLRPTARPRGATAVVGGRDREALGSRRACGSATRRRAACVPRAPLRAADARVGRRSRRRRPTAPASASRSRQLAEQDPLIDRPPGRRRAGALGLALRGGAEGGDPGDARERLRPRRHVPRDDRRSASSGRSARGEAVEILHADVEPVRGHDRPARRPGAASARASSFQLDVDPAIGTALRLQDARGIRGQHGASTCGARSGRACAGWQVTDCVVTMKRCTYQSRRRPGRDPRPAEHGRRLPEADADRRTCRRSSGRGPIVCEPVLRVRLEVPADVDRRVFSARWAVSARPGETPSARARARATIEAELPAARVQELQRQLPALTGGEGVLESDFAGYRPVAGEPPVRSGRKWCG